MGSSSTTERNVLSRILSGELNDFATGEVSLADSYLDLAIDILDSEEPTLAHWLEADPELQRLLTAQITAVARMVYQHAQAGMDYNQSMARVNALFFRVVCAAAYYAVQSERPFALAGLRLMVEEPRGTAEIAVHKARGARSAADLPRPRGSRSASTE